MYCIKCGRESKTLEGECEYCHEPLVTHELDHEETRLLNKALHTRINASREEVDNAMVFIVLGATLLVVGILFFFLSYKLPTAYAQYKEVDVTCFEFWVSMAGLVAGGVLFVIGLVRLLIQKLVVQHEAYRVLRAVQSGHYHHLQLHSLEEREEK